MQTFTAPVDGVYKLEVWGAQGGQVAVYGGKGGYSIGYINLDLSNNLFVCVGEIGNTNTEDWYSFHYNGGGASAIAGGGASHIAITNHGELYNYSEYRDEVAIVAGGGGGGERFQGGFGGGLTGGDGGTTNLTGSVHTIEIYSKGGSQSAGGSAGHYGNDNGQPGTFGRGGQGYSTPKGDTGGGGGGGWYGGGGINFVGAGGGGSGHINTTLIVNGETIAGDHTFPKPGGETETGHSGNGYAIISWISPSL